MRPPLTINGTIECNILVLRGRGQVLLSNDIQFDNVPIVTPNGDILLRNLTFNVKTGVSAIGNA
jgi:ATP-binding cassette subfamily D (ALD) long-chain fatty acid import protein